MSLLLLIGLILLLVLGTCASCGWERKETMNREVWFWLLLLLAISLLFPNRWLGAVTACVAVGMLLCRDSWVLLRSVLIPALALASTYLALAPSMERWMVRPVLWTGVGIGVYLGIRCAVSLWLGRAYAWRLEGWWGVWKWQETGDRWSAPTCGQWNLMHLRALCAVTLAALAGLCLLDQWWALAAAPLCLVPLLPRDWQDGPSQQETHLHQGWLHLSVVGLALLWFWHPWLSLGGGLAGGAVGLRRWSQWDSGRSHYWRQALRQWWREPWLVRLLGYGTGTWMTVTRSIGEQHRERFTTAHNEFVQQVVEHGLVGLGALMGFLGTTLWRCAAAGPEGRAVALLGLVLCSIAFVNFPWTLPHDYQTCSFGAPSLNTVSVVTLLLSEAV